LSNLCFMSVNINSITASRTGQLVALLRPENYLLVLFAISTTLWTMAFLFYFLSTRAAALLATVARAAHVGGRALRSFSPQSSQSAQSRAGKI
jgi:hypothetical protein